MLITTTSGGKQVRLDQSGNDHIYFIRRTDQKTIDITDSLATGNAAEFSRLNPTLSHTEDFNGNMDLGVSKDKAGQCVINALPDTDASKLFTWAHQQFDGNQQITKDVAEKALFDIKYVNVVTGDWALLEAAHVAQLPNTPINNQNGGSTPLAYTVVGAEYNVAPVSEEDAGLA